MPLKFYQKREILKTLQEKTTYQRLGEILHFLIEHLLYQKIFNPSREELKILITKAISFNQELLSEREFLEEKAYNILSKALKSEAWKFLKDLLSEPSEIYYEIEGFYQKENQGLRPDLLIVKNSVLYLIEIKLHQEDLKEEQINLYLSFLKELYPSNPIKVYLLTLEPFKLTLLQEIKAEGETHTTYGNKGLFHSTQLSIFEKFS
ncbi:MAG: hypothetical protein ACP5KO_02140 [Caldimicrobium sp.]